MANLYDHLSRTCKTLIDNNVTLIIIILENLR